MLSWPPSGANKANVNIIVLQIGRTASQESMLGRRLGYALPLVPKGSLHGPSYPCPAPERYNLYLFTGTGRGVLNSLLKVNIIGLNKSEPLKIVILQILKTKKTSCPHNTSGNILLFASVSHEAT